MSPLLQVKDVVVAYGEVVALHGVSIEVGADELVVILGANGAGKTTLMSTIIGWLRPRSGSVVFDGENLTSMQPWRRSELGIALVPEGGRIFSDLSVQENLDLVRPDPAALDMAMQLFPALKERRKQVSKTLSGGERQMLALARAIVTSPKLLLVDEASTGLMPKLVDRVFEALLELRRSGPPVLLVEQNTKALHIADRGYVMATGEIVHHGNAAELVEDPQVRKAYLGG